MKHPPRLVPVAVALSLLVSACAGPSVEQTQTTTTRPDQQPAFVGKIWMATDSSAALGTLRIFLPDGTLVMDSCGETYRLVRWTSNGEGRITWEEDGARIEAEIARATPDELQLRLRLVSELKAENYRRALVPYVCPDSRPNPAGAVTPLRAP